MTQEPVKHPASKDIAAAVETHVLKKQAEAATPVGNEVIHENFDENRKRPWKQRIGTTIVQHN